MEQISVEQDFNERLRVLESRYSLMRERMVIINQNMIGEYKKSSQDLKEMNNDLNEIKKDMADLKDSMGKIIKELGLFARKSDVKVIEKYVTLWNPMNFVTEKDVLSIINKVGDKNSKAE